MPVAMPRVVRQGWGEEVVEAFVPWLKEEIYETVKEKAVPRDEYREVLSRLDGLEKDTLLVKEEQARMRTEFREDLSELRREMHERFDRVNERFDEMGARFDGRLDEMGARFDWRLDEMGARFDGRLDDMHHQMIVQTRWLIGSLALIGTVVSVLLAIAQFTP